MDIEMDTALLVTVVLLSILCLLSLLLNFGVIRRLRALEGRIDQLAAGSPDAGPARQLYLDAGGSVPEVSFTDVTGRVHSTSTLGPAVYGFFSPQCSSCHERLPEFLAYAGQQSGSVVSVIVRDGGDTEHLIQVLGEVGMVVVEDVDDPLTAAFQISAFPVFAIVDSGGIVRSSGYTLPQTVA